MRSQVRASIALGVVSICLVALLVGRTGGTTTGVTFALLGVGVMAIVGWWSLRTGRHVPWSTAAQRAAREEAVVRWKPGCPYCERLLRACGDDYRITWVNVWKDDDANRVVHELNGGDEYVPTLIVGDRVLRNPDAAAVLPAH